MTKISIIVPIYNSSLYLERCLDSLINQSYKNIEIVLVNDGSKDNSLDVCNKYKKKDKRIVVINKKNTGVSDTRNVGIKASHGEYITFCDSDDFLEPDAIENMISLAEKNKVDVVRTNLSIDGNVPELSNDLLGLKEGNDLKNILFNIVNGRIKTYSVLLLIRKSIIDEHNLLFNEQVSMMEDTLFYLDLVMCINSFYFSNVKTYNYLIYPSSSSRDNGRAIKNIDSVILVCMIMKNKLEKELYKKFCIYIYTILCNFIIENIKYGLYDDIDELFYHLNDSSNFKEILKFVNRFDVKKNYLIIYDAFNSNDFDYLKKNIMVIKRNIKKSSILNYFKNKFNLSKHYNNLKYKKNKIVSSIKNKGNH